MGLSAVGGPILAGWLVSADYFGWGWRMIFAINVPIGIVALVAARGCCRCHGRTAACTSS
jgi:MFS family permease